MTAFSLAFVLIRVLALYFFLMTLWSVPFAFVNTGDADMSLGRYLERFYGFFPLIVCLGFWFGSRQIATFITRPILARDTVSSGPSDLQAVAALSAALIGLWLTTIGIRGILVGLISTLNELHYHQSAIEGLLFDWPRIWVAPIVNVAIGLGLLLKSNSIGALISTDVIRGFANRMRNLGMDRIKPKDD